MLTNLNATVRAVEDAIDLILEALPPAEQANYRLVAVSALADGADRIVAHHILARHGSRLEVILPLPKLEYMNDFNDKSCADFEFLMAKASWITTVPKQPTREKAYYASGQAVVDRANVTIAIWDGRETSRVGGTAEVVKYIRQTKRPLVWINPDSLRIVTENIKQLANIQLITTNTNLPALFYCAPALRMRRRLLSSQGCRGGGPAIKAGYRFTILMRRYACRLVHDRAA
jgi:hypothetical protein